MSASFFDSFDPLAGESSQRFASSESQYVNDSIIDDSSVFSSIQNDDVFIPHPTSETQAPPPIFVSACGFSKDPVEFSSFSPEVSGDVVNGGYVSSGGPILPSLDEMQPEEGYALKEWRRQNAVRLEEKERREKELLGQIIDEAHDYKVDFHRRRIHTCETNKATNREKEKVRLKEIFVASTEKFHAEADKNYWKTIAELVPNEIAAIEKKRGKKDQDKKQPSVVMIQGPKPGKPTDLSRMRQILLKLKHNTPPHLKTVPPSAPAGPTKDAKVAAVPSAAFVAGSTKAVDVA